MVENRFLAIDFEIANRNMASACSVGIVVFEDGVLVDQMYHVIKPHPSLHRFDEDFIEIHHITPEDVSEALEFDALWPHLKPYFEDTYCVAHNAAFDAKVLVSLLNLYDLEDRAFYFVDTVKLSRKVFRFLPNHKLSTVAQALELDLNHHHALSDSIAAASIVNRLMVLTSEFEIKSLCETLGVGIERYVTWE